MLETPFVATAPSNIALVKYWGKRDAAVNWPANDSLSMTLTAARTITAALPLDGADDEITRDGKRTDSPNDKARRHLAFLRAELGFTRKLKIETRNTFPSDCGIASSASGLAALTVAALAAWTGAEDLAALEQAGFPRARLASLARRGSGSACRSLYGGFVEWRAGVAPAEQTVNCLASAADWPLADVIVILSRAPKAASSTDAHGAAWSSPLFPARLAGLPARLARVKQALETRDLAALGPEIEADAFEMHAVMMSGAPAAHYMTPETARLLAWTREERAKGQLDAYFTLDAGPNPHLICDTADAARVAARVRADFPGAELIIDEAGPGPALTKGFPRDER